MPHKDALDRGMKIENGLSQSFQSITKNESTLIATYRTLSCEILDGNKHIKLIRTFVTVRGLHLEKKTSKIQTKHK